MANKTLSREWCARISLPLLRIVRIWILKQFSLSTCGQRNANTVSLPFLVAVCLVLWVCVCVCILLQFGWLGRCLGSPRARAWENESDPVQSGRRWAACRKHGPMVSRNLCENAQCLCYRFRRHRSDSTTIVTCDSVIYECYNGWFRAS